MSEIKNIPRHWQVKKLGEVCKLINGFAFKSNIYKIEGIPVIRISDIKAGIVSGDNSVRVDAKSEYENYLVENNDILVAMSGATTGKFGIYKSSEKAYQNQRVGKFKILDEGILDNQFLFHLINSLKMQIEKDSYGGAQPNISSTKIEQMKIAVPPLPEQLAIVSKIEELLSDLENGKQQLLTAQQQLKVYRQSLLKGAFEGKLTERKTKWENVKLGDIANAIDPQPSHRTPPIAQDGIPYVSIKDFDPEKDKIDFTYARKVSQNILEEHLIRYKLEVGDFVIGKIGTIGKPVRIVLPQNYTLSANIVLIQPRKVNPTYLYYFFQSNLVEKAFTAGMNATTQAAFGIQKVRELRIELPNNDEQQLIVSELESKLTVCDKIEETITNSLLQVETLRQSILKKAFEGKLT